jgi:putative two-component system response regulator
MEQDMVVTRERILVVDDDPNNRHLFQAFLEPLEVEINSACNGYEALERIQSWSPDLVLLDVMMPGMDGFDVLTALKGERDSQGIPVVMITALQDVESRVKAYEAGADDLLSKPIDSIELQARARSLLKVKAYNDQKEAHQVQLEQEVERRTRALHASLEQVKQASLEAIYPLAKAAEYKDEDTGAHVQRMSGYSVAIARQMGFGDQFLEALLYAAPMHDVGKLGIPDHILLKPGKLEPDEWEIMKRHTSIGGAILGEAGSDFMQLARTIALTHHERWDGSGYPNGLKGHEIPQAGRITALADVFDALTSRRPYKAPFSVERSLAIIQEGRGTHFDPAVVDAFFAGISEIMAIQERYRDEDPNGFAGQRASSDACLDASMSEGKARSKGGKAVYASAA